MTNGTTPPPTGGGTTTPPRARGSRGIADTTVKIVNQLFNKAKKPLARFFANRFLTPTQRKKIADDGDTIETAATIAAIVTPHGGWWELTDDNLQDFVHEVVEVCKEIVATGSTTTPVAPVAPTFDTGNQLYRLIMAMGMLPDPRPFDDWFGHLSSNDQERFLRFIARLSDADLATLIAKDTVDLDVLLARTPALPTAPTPPAGPLHLAYPALHAAIAADRALSTDVAHLISRLNTAGIDEARFWTCVEKHIHTLEDFRDLVALPADEVVLALHLVPLLERAQEWWEQNVAAHLASATTQVRNKGRDALDQVRLTRDEVVHRVDTAIQDINKSPSAKGFSDRASARRQKWADKLKSIKK